MNQMYRGALVRNRNADQHRAELKINYQQYRKAVRKADLIDTLKVLPWVLVLVAAYGLFVWLQNSGVAS